MRDIQHDGDAEAKIYRICVHSHRQLRERLGVI
jgi:hypothetical protein